MNDNPRLRRGIGRNSLNVLRAVRMLLGDRGRWTKVNLAEDIAGNPVVNWDDAAVRWSLFGAVVFESHGAANGVRDGALFHLDDTCKMLGSNFDEALIHIEVLAVLDRAVATYESWATKYDVPAGVPAIESFRCLTCRKEFPGSQLHDTGFCGPCAVKRIHTFDVKGVMKADGPFVVANRKITQLGGIVMGMMTKAEQTATASVTCDLCGVTGPVAQRREDGHGLGPSLPHSVEERCNREAAEAGWLIMEVAIYGPSADDWQGLRFGCWLCPQCRKKDGLQVFTLKCRQAEDKPHRGSFEGTMK